MEESGSLKKLFTKFDEKKYAPIMGKANSLLLKKFATTRYREEKEEEK